MEVFNYYNVIDDNVIYLLDYLQNIKKSVLVAVMNNVLKIP